MGGKPSKGTKKDKRLKKNRKRASGKLKPPFSSTRSTDGQYPI